MDTVEKHLKVQTQAFVNIYQEAISPEDCKKIINFINSTELKPGVMSGGNVKKANPKIKDSLDTTLNFSDSSLPTEILKNALHFCSQDYIKRNYELQKIQEFGLSDTYNLQKYNPGQGYHSSHCENAGGVNSFRVLAWMVYLNTVNDGGGTSFDNYGFETRAQEGALLIWPAFWTHFHHGVVSPTETKYIATGWYSYTNFLGMPCDQIDSIGVLNEGEEPPEGAIVVER